MAQIEIIDDKYVLGWTDHPEALPVRQELAEDQQQVVERNSNRLVILEWVAGGAALMTAGVVYERLTKPRRKQRARFA